MYQGCLFIDYLDTFLVYTVFTSLSYRAKLFICSHLEMRLDICSFCLCRIHFADIQKDKGKATCRMEQYIGFSFILPLYHNNR